MSLRPGRHFPERIDACLYTLLPSIPVLAGGPRREASIALISRAMELLNSYTCANLSQVEGTSANFRNQSITEVIHTLRLLQGSIADNNRTVTTPMIQDHFGDFGTAPNYITPHVAAHISSSVGVRNSNALESLNNIDIADWMWTGLEPFPLIP